MSKNKLKLCMYKIVGNERQTSHCQRKNLQIRKGRGLEGNLLCWIGDESQRHEYELISCLMCMGMDRYQNDYRSVCQEAPRSSDPQ